MLLLQTYTNSQRITPVIRTYHARVLCVSRPRYVRITGVIRWEFIQAYNGMNGNTHGAYPFERIDCYDEV